MNIALLIIDMQKEFYENNNLKPMLDNALEYINETSQIFRRANKPVIIIQDKEAGQGPSSHGFENIESLLIEDSDKSIYKFHSNSFWETDLEALLTALKVDYLIISGFAAEHCVLFTYNGALERGYGASLLQHGIAGLEKENVDSIQQIRSVISIEALGYFIK